jgi:hypothetical protein
MERNQRTGDIAGALGLSCASIQAYARNGRIPYRKTPGDQYRFDLQEVREVLGLADIEARDDLVSVFSTDAKVVVDALSAYRNDPNDAASLRRARIRAVRPRRQASTVELTQGAGGIELAELVKAGHGAAVAVLRREHANT